MFNEVITALAIIFIQMFNMWNVKQTNDAQIIYVKQKFKRTKAKLRKEFSKPVESLLEKKELTFEEIDERPRHNQAAQRNESPVPTKPNAPKKRTRTPSIVIASNNANKTSYLA